MTTRSLVLLLLLFGAFAASAQTGRRVWTEAERDYLLRGLDSTRNVLLGEVAGLTPAQLHFKPDSAQWSVAEVLEHLGVWEEILLWDLFSHENSPERRDLLHLNKGKDSATLAYATDPSKGTSPLIALPLGRFHTAGELTGFFNRFRNEVIRSVRESRADYRLHYIYRPKEWGEGAQRDMHQYTLLFIAHTTRHTNQVQRVKAHPAFPK